MSHTDPLDRALSLPPGVARMEAIIAALAQRGLRPRGGGAATQPQPRRPAVWPPTSGPLADRWERLAICFHEAGHCLISELLWPGSVDAVSVGYGPDGDTSLGVTAITDPKTATPGETLLTYAIGPAVHEALRSSAMWPHPGELGIAGRGGDRLGAELALGRPVSWADFDFAMAEAGRLIADWSVQLSAIARHLGATGYLDGSEVRRLVHG